VTSRCISYEINEFFGIGVIIPCVGKVKTCHSHPVCDEFVNHLLGVGRWTESANNFGHAAEGGGDFFEGVETSLLDEGYVMRRRWQEGCSLERLVKD
jgi:hypothetical protein